MKVKEEEEEVEKMKGLEQRYKNPEIAMESGSTFCLLEQRPARWGIEELCKVES